MGILGAGADGVGVLDEEAAIAQHTADRSEDLPDIGGRQRAERERRDDVRHWPVSRNGQFACEVIQIAGIAMMDPNLRKTPLQVLGEPLATFDGDQAGGGNTGLKQGVGDGPGSGTELNDVTLGLPPHQRGNPCGKDRRAGTRGPDLSGIGDQLTSEHVQG